MATTIRGVTWDAPRGVQPLEASVPRIRELFDADVVWERRSLWSFGEEPFDRFADAFDLIVLDHPLVGYAVAHDLLVPFEQPVTELTRIADDAIGASWESYLLDGTAWALPIDAAAQVCARRPDLLDEGSLPQDWSELVALAHRSQRVLASFSPVNTLCLFLALCANQGAALFEDDRLVDPAAGRRSLEALRELAASVPSWCLDANPIAVLDALAEDEKWMLAAPLFGYSNYGREGYRTHFLAFSDFLPLVGNAVAGSTLGGAGLGVSSRSSHPELAARIARHLADPAEQAAAYVRNGGQPAARSAWLDDEANRETADFFRSTIRTLETAYLRPNWNGMERFQPPAGELLHRYLAEDLPPGTVLEDLDDLLRGSREPR